MTNLRLLTFFLCFVTTSFAQAQFLGAKPIRERGRVQLGYQKDTLSENSSDRPTESMEIVDAKVGLKVYKSPVWNFLIGGSIESVDTGSNNTLIGASNTPVKRTLVNQSFNVSANKKIDDEGRSLGLVLSYGSASDNSFGAERDSAISLTGTYSFAKKETSQWLFFANYSNNRAFLNNVPIPSFMYIYRPSKTFTASFGFPFISLNWISFPTYMYQINLSPAGYGINLSRGVWKFVQAYILTDYKVRTYMHESRALEEDRLFLEEKRVMVGAKSPISKELSLDLGVGYSFDRYLSEGESIFSEDINKQSLSKDLFISTKIVFNF